MGNAAIAVEAQLSSPEQDKLVLLQAIIDRYETIKIKHGGEALDAKELYQELQNDGKLVDDIRQALAISGPSRKSLNESRDFNGFPPESPRDGSWKERYRDGHSVAHRDALPNLNDGPDSGAGRATVPSNRRSILVVDDSPVSRKLASRVISKLGHSCALALNGEGALTILREKPTAFDLVLLDIVMPGLDGIEVLKRMKQSPTLAKIPVIMLSALEDQALSADCRTQGALDVIAKPLDATIMNRILDFVFVSGPRSSNKKSSNGKVIGGSPGSIGSRTLEVGDIGPDFELLDLAMSPVSSQRQREVGCRLLLVFLPRPSIDVTILQASLAEKTLEVEELKKRLPSVALLKDLSVKAATFRAQETEVVAVCHATHALLHDALGGVDLNIRVLSDPNLDVSAKYVGQQHVKGVFGATAEHREEREIETCKMGAVLLSEKGDVLYRMTTIDERGEELCAQKLLEAVERFPTSSKGLGASAAGTSLMRRGSSTLSRSGAFSYQRGTTTGSLPNVTPTKAENRVGLKILVVDDSHISAKLAVKKLTNLGHHATRADNGKIALDMLQDPSVFFDLILLDIIMPVMDGMQLLAALKEDAYLRSIRVFMLSGLEDESLAEECMQSGAVAVLKKPINTDEVQELINKYQIVPARYAPREYQRRVSL